MRRSLAQMSSSHKMLSLAPVEPCVEAASQLRGVNPCHGKGKECVPEEHLCMDRRGARGGGRVVPVKEGILDTYIGDGLE